MKLLTHIFTFAYFLTTAATFSAVAGDPSIAAIVNDKSILTSDVNHRLNLILKGSQGDIPAEALKKLRMDVLQQMIDEILQQQLVTKFEIKVEESEIKAARGTYENRMGLSAGELEGFLKQNNIPERIVKEQMSASLGWQKYIQSRYGEQATVTEAEVKAELDKLEQQKQKKQALLSEIVIKSDDPAESRKKAEEVSAKIRAGAPFPLIAQQYSHSASAARGGDIGWVSLEEMDTETKKVVENARRGEVTMPIAVSGGYRILGVRDRHGVGSLGESVEYVSFQQVEFKFPMFGGQQAMQDTYIAAQTIRDNARSCSLMKKMTDGRPRIKAQSVERVPMDSMHPELAKVLRKLKPGDRSELLNTGDGFIMFMMCEKDVVQPHEPDEKEIRFKLREKKLGVFFEKELRALRRTALIDVRLGK